MGLNGSVRHLLAGLYLKQKMIFKIFMEIHQLMINYIKNWD